MSQISGLSVSSTPPMKIIHFDCLEYMKTMESNSIDGILTDPPYGLNFMGKKWDYDIPSIYIWKEALRVSKPGAMMLAFGGSRTYHRLACAIEDAGWEIRDCIMWIYGSGFPKSMDLSKAIDKDKGVKREVIGNYGRSFRSASKETNSGWDRPSHDNNGDITAPFSELAKQFDGYGTALKPAYEPILVCMKPLDGTFAQNAEKWGVAGINIEECRIESELPEGRFRHGGGKHSEHIKQLNPEARNLIPSGRWPANILFDEEAAPLIGEASRFFYCPKASRSERGENNIHPCVKPIKLLEYLLKLITPPNPEAVILDPFLGSGSTLVAAKNLGIDAIGIEINDEYFEISKNRIKNEVI